MKTSWLERLRRNLSETASLPELLDAAVRVFQVRVKAQRVEMVIAQGEASVRRYSGPTPGSSTGGAGIVPPLTFTSKGIFLDGIEVRGVGLFHAGMVGENPCSTWLKANALGSLLIVPVYLRGKIAGFLSAHWPQPHHIHQTFADAQGLATMVALESHRFLRVISNQPSIRKDFERLIDVGQLVVMRTDAQFVISELIGNSEVLLGVPREDLIHNLGVWKRLFNEGDLRALRQKLRTLSLAEELKEEVRLLNQRTGESRWLLVRGIALRNEDGTLAGWELYGVDITDKHLADEGLHRERERLAALFQLSQAVESLAAPELVCSRGIAALAKSTGADAAFAAVTNPDTGRVELIALSGFPENQIQNLEEALQRQSLVRTVIEKNDGLIVEQIPSDTRVSAVDVMAQEKLMNAVLAPLRNDSGGAIGALALFSRTPGRWTIDEQQFLDAAGLLISSALQRSNELVAQRHDNEQYQMLYALNHELARLVTISEIGAHALQVACTVVPSHNAWFALMAPSGDSLVGQSGVGPRLTRAVIESRVALNDTGSTELSAWLSQRRITILAGNTDAPADAWQRALPMLKTFGDGLKVAIPLVTLNQVIGLVILEPSVPQILVEARLGLLQALAAEVGMVVFARRLESKMTEADKMRVTGHLAAGVAHNFNNILQGILGHASLLQSQMTKGSTLRASAEQIIEAANRGGQLIKQLSGLAQIQGSVRKTVDMGSFLMQSRELYSSALGAKISLIFDIKKQLPTVYADESLVQQVVMNLLVNAREAIGERTDGVVRVTAETVTVKAGELREGSLAGRYVRISVADNGVGMSPDLATRCFEPFYSTKGVDPRSGLSLSGAGLGLSSAYAIVREHEGYLDVRTGVGKGSSFVVLLPALTVNEPRKSETSRVINAKEPIVTDQSSAQTDRMNEALSGKNTGSVYGQK